MTPIFNLCSEDQIEDFLYLLEKEQCNFEKGELHLEKTKAENERSTAVLQELDSEIEAVAVRVAEQRVRVRKLRSIRQFKAEQQAEARRIRDSMPSHVDLKDEMVTVVEQLSDIRDTKDAGQIRVK